MSCFSICSSTSKPPVPDSENASRCCCGTVAKVGALVTGLILIVGACCLPSDLSVVAYSLGAVGGAFLLYAIIAQITNWCSAKAKPALHKNLTGKSNSSPSVSTQAIRNKDSRDTRSSMANVQTTPPSQPKKEQEFISFMYGASQDTDFKRFTDFVMLYQQWINLQDQSGSTLLHYVIKHSKKCVGDKVACLLNAGANPNLQDLNGNTPLHIAVGLDRELSAEEWLEGPSLALLTILNEAGADWEIENISEVTASSFLQSEFPERLSQCQSFTSTKFT